jgi:hypothetical protein
MGGMGGALSSTGCLALHTARHPATTAPIGL